MPSAGDMKKTIGTIREKVASEEEAKRLADAAELEEQENDKDDEKKKKKNNKNKKDGEEEEKKEDVTTEIGNDKDDEKNDKKKKKKNNNDKDDEKKDEQEDDEEKNDKKKKKKNNKNGDDEEKKESVDEEAPADEETPAEEEDTSVNPNDTSEETTDSSDGIPEDVQALIADLDEDLVRTFEAGPFKVEVVGVEGNKFFITINDQKYGYQVKSSSTVKSARELSEQFKAILKHSAGRAVAWLKKNTVLVSGGKRKLGDSAEEKILKVVCPDCDYEDFKQVQKESQLVCPRCFSDLYIKEGGKVNEDIRSDAEKIHNARQRIKEKMDKAAVMKVATSIGKKAFGDDFDEKKIKGMVDGIIKKAKDTEEAIAIVQASFTK